MISKLQNQAKVQITIKIKIPKLEKYLEEMKYSTRIIALAALTV